ncbi:Purine nucleoside permease [Halorubrum aquaticum]|uniref:Purine nucleoside permease n=1 Tax=Halorubrum aquaticum TaxID=387340 RepID=A0A1I3BC81_9EURY|nr:phosphorylase [Halorubrum aquaticum]SFH59892.1 Purine nucleoside permease [Halorubrum aquaticum]
MPVELDALVLPAFEDLDPLPSAGEVGPWRDAYDLTERTDVPGVAAPLRRDGAGLGVVPTGIGKTAAATTTAALCADDAVDLSDALVLSVGIAGAPPDLPIGSVVIADEIVDWDDKCRFDPDDGPAGADADAGDDADAEDVPIAPDPYTEGRGVVDLEPDLVSDAVESAAGVDLASVEEAPEPAVTVGTNVCADELWHGRTVADHVSWLLEALDRGPYRATEMEDAGTAAALRRFGLADRYLSVRGISNHDRPEPGESSRESFETSLTEAGLETGLANAVRVARAVVDDRRA